MSTKAVYLTKEEVRAIAETLRQESARTRTPKEEALLKKLDQELLYWGIGR